MSANGVAAASRTIAFGISATAPDTFDVTVRITDGQGTTKPKLFAERVITVNVVDPGLLGYVSFDQVVAQRYDVFLPKHGLNVLFGPAYFAIGIYPTATSRYLNNVQGLCGSNFDRNATNDMVNPVTGSMFKIASVCSRPPTPNATAWAVNYDLRTYQGQLFKHRIPELEAMRSANPMELMLDREIDLNPQPIHLDNYDALKAIMGFCLKEFPKACVLDPVVENCIYDRLRVQENVEVAQAVINGALVSVLFFAI